MSLSDCINCWDTPCTCGWKYFRWDDEDIKSLIKVLQCVMKFRRQQFEVFGDYRDPYNCVDLEEIRVELMNRFREELKDD